MDQLPILFSDSNLYFQDTLVLQAKVGFISPLDIDIYVKSSFSYIANTIRISGGSIDAFNKDHMVDDRCICYKLQLTTGEAIIPSQGIITFDLENQGLLGKNFIQGLIQGMPLVSLIALAILTSIAPPTLAKILEIISVIGIVITCLFYTRKILKMLYKVLVSKAIKYNGISIIYENGKDNLTLSPEYIDMLKEINKKLKIEKIVLFQGALYLKQVTEKTTIRQAITNVFKERNNTTEADNAMIRSTVQFLLTTSFISPSNTTP